jgi:hypothetical protein
VHLQPTPAAAGCGRRQFAANAGASRPAIDFGEILAGDVPQHEPRIGMMGAGGLHPSDLKTAHRFFCDKIPYALRLSAGRITHDPPGNRRPIFLRVARSFREDTSMPDFRLPLSGDVTQTFNINLGTSSDPAIEKQVLSDQASYGKQLGRIADVLIVLLKHVNLSGLSPDEEKAICDLKCMLHEIANVKDRHGAKLVLRPSP